MKPKFRENINVFFFQLLHLLPFYYTEKIALFKVYSAIFVIYLVSPAHIIMPPFMFVTSKPCCSKNVVACAERPPA